MALKNKDILDVDSVVKNTEKLHELLTTDPVVQAQVFRLSGCSIGMLVDFFKHHGILTKESKPNEVLSILTSALLFCMDAAMPEIIEHLAEEEEEGNFDEDAN